MWKKRILGLAMKWLVFLLDYCKLLARNIKQLTLSGCSEFHFLLTQFPGIISTRKSICKLQKRATINDLLQASTILENIHLFSKLAIACTFLPLTELTQQA